MASDIEKKCTSRSLYAQYASQAPKEPMFSHDPPHFSWSVVSQDILTTCHYSDWVEIDVLPNTLTATVVQLTKAHYARIGIPKHLVTENGPSFISSDYNQFGSEYGFEHLTSSPYHTTTIPIQLELGKLMFSFNHSLLPPKFNDYFSLNKQVHNYATRYANDFHFPFCRTNLRRFSASFQAPTYYNSLENDIKESSSLHSFKTKLKKK